jgi:N-acyl-D-amino-acid deacylase
VQFSHIGITESYLYGKGQELIAVFERARSEGVDMVFDMYPYTAAGIDLHQVVPVWVREGGVEETMARLEDPSTRDRARRETTEGADGREPPDWDSIVISSVLTDRNAGAVGLSIRQISDDTGEDPAETALRLIHEERDIVSAVIHNRREGDVRYFLSQPMGMIGSDGNAISPNGRLADTVPHPRFYGTYPRVLGRYVREQPAVMTLEEAVYKCAGFPAQRLGLEDRGLVKEGLVADLVVFDPETVIDRATFEQPQQYPDGIPYVIVNGTPVVWEGKNTGARPGRVLRRGE